MPAHTRLPGTGHKREPAVSELVATGMGQPFLAMPFDAMRMQYAGAVNAGLTRRSILASAKLEQTLDRLERLILGPLARQR